MLIVLGLLVAVRNVQLVEGDTAYPLANAISRHREVTELDRMGLEDMRDFNLLSEYFPRRPSLEMSKFIISSNLSSNCNSSLLYILDELLYTHNSWPVNIIDSIGRPQPGLSDGNFFWLGRYSECSAISQLPNGTAFSVATLGLALGNTTKLSVRQGICSPAACSDDLSDLINFAIKWLESSLHKDNVTTINVTLQGISLVSSTPIWTDIPGMSRLSALAFFLFVVVLATALDLLDKCCPEEDEDDCIIVVDEERNEDEKEKEDSHSNFEGYPILDLSRLESMRPYSSPGSSVDSADGSSVEHKIDVHEEETVSSIPTILVQNWDIQQESGSDNESLDTTITNESDDTIKKDLSEEISLRKIEDNYEITGNDSEFVKDITKDDVVEKYKEKDITSEKAGAAQKFSRQKKDESTYKHTHEIKKDIDFGEVYSMSQENLSLYDRGRSEDVNMAAWGMIEFPYGMDHVDGIGEDKLEDGRGWLKRPHGISEELVASLYINNKALDETLRNAEVEKESHPSMKSNIQPKKGVSFRNIILSFSLLKNFSKLSSLEGSSEDLDFLHGLRFISMTWVILGHTFILSLPFIDNPKWALDMARSNFSFQAILQGTFAVDTFFFVSGLLMTYLLMRRRRSDDNLTYSHWASMVAHRFLRIVPAYLALVVLIQPLSAFLCTGPLCPDKPSENCPRYWWRNILNIQNFFGYSEMCAGWTWYLALDFQFFTAAVLLASIYFIIPPLATVLLFGILLGGWISTVLVAGQYNIQPDILKSIGQPQDSIFDNYYDKPWTRAGPYIIGLITGYLINRLYETKVLKLNWKKQFIGWTLSVSMSCAVIFGLYKSDLSSTWSELYTSLARSVWAVCLAWVSVCCSIGLGGPVTWVLSLPGMKPFSRLTYTAYLIHPIIINLYFTNLEVPFHGSVLNYSFLYLSFLLSSYAAALVYSLVFESPWINVQKQLGTLFGSGCSNMAWCGSMFSLLSLRRNNSQKHKNEGLTEENQRILNGDQSPRMSASFFSRIFFTWCTPLIYAGAKSPLSLNALWKIYPDQMSVSLTNLFFTSYNKSQANVDQKRNSILPALLKSFGGSYIICLIFKIISDVLLLLTPKIMKLIIKYADSNDPNRVVLGCSSSAFLFLICELQSIFANQFTEKLEVLNLKIKSTLLNAVYYKSLKISSSDARFGSVGKIVTLMSVDTQSFSIGLKSITLILSAFLKVSFSTYSIYVELEEASFVGLTVLLTAIPFNIMLGKFWKHFQWKQMTIKEKRIQELSKILSGIEALKLYAWELPFINQILDTRNDEVVALKKATAIFAIMSLLWTIAPILYTLCAFTYFVEVLEKNLTAEKAFVTVSYTNILTNPLLQLPKNITDLIQCSVSLQRINKFMNCAELHNNLEKTTEDGCAIDIENGTFHWSAECPPVLNNINIKVLKGSFTIVLGPVGSGKTSLLAAILGDLYTAQGTIKQVGKVAYVPQQAWIYNSSFKNNITFGNPAMNLYYGKAINASALSSDILQLPYGDKTMMGEKGINLSGGQKQRISLARAACSKSDIYLLDDPLSALDTNVGEHIFDNLIGPKGILKNCTRILVTHGTKFLKYADNIIVLKNGCITKQVRFVDLKDKCGETGNIFTHDAKNFVDPTIDRKRDANCSSLGDSGERLIKTIDIMKQDKLEEEDQQQKSLEESIETGSVKFNVYLYYIRAFGKIGVWFSMVMLLILTTALVMTGYWLNWWTQNKFNRDYSFYIIIYGCIGLVQGVSNILLTSVFIFNALNASNSMHKQMFECIIKSPMAFFYKNPVGRILNRFSFDLQVCDYTLPSNLLVLLSSIAKIVGAMISMIPIIPMILLIFVPACFLFYLIQRIYLKTSRQLNRLDAVTRSLIYANVSDTFNGSSSIRAYHLEDKFRSKFNSIVDDNIMCPYSRAMANIWLRIRMDLIGNAITFGAAIFCVLGSRKGGDVGYIISYCFSILSNLSWFVKISADIETNSVSIERIYEYSQLSTEAPWVIPAKRPNRKWPEKGVIKFSNIFAQYGKEISFAVNDVSFVIEGGQKVALVGRTGAGKSSVTLALFRILESCLGKIEVDGLDISTIGLHDLRRKIAIIPQTPLLFPVSLRMNLDPLGNHTDCELWNALEMSNLSDFIAGLEGGLSHELKDGGDSLSVGQRQLICLARVLLRKAKVLVLDEATAALDTKTDSLIQDTIRTAFAGSTVITIAHRIQTIMDYDKVLVFEQGQLVQADTPANLLNNTEGIFHQLACKS